MRPGYYLEQFQLYKDNKANYSVEERRKIKLQLKKSLRLGFKRFIDAVDDINGIVD